MKVMFKVQGPILATIAVCSILAVTPLLAGFIEDGALVYTDGGYTDQKEPQIAPDGAGGAFIVWQDDEDGYRIVAQRIDQYGHILWPEAGVIVCDESMEQYDPLICSDGAGGAIIVWGDNRNKGFEDEWDIYGQRLDSGGIAQWTAGGIDICTRRSRSGRIGRRDHRLGGLELRHRK